MFERGRATSLLLFEHVHAESRDRGRDGRPDESVSAGGSADRLSQLPDHLPLYLGISVFYLPRRREGAAEYRADSGAIGGRLKQRACPYYQLFDALLRWLKARSPVTASQNSGGEKRDDTRQALDAVWEEEQVKFIEDNATACDSSSMQAYQRRFSQMWPQ